MESGHRTQPGEEEEEVPHSEQALVFHAVVAGYHKPQVAHHSEAEEGYSPA